MSAEPVIAGHAGCKVPSHAGIGAEDRAHADECRIGSQMLLEAYARYWRRHHAGQGGAR